MKSEAVGGDIIHADAVGAGAGGHVVNVEVIDVPRFGGTASGDCAYRDAGIGGCIAQSDGTQVVAVGELATAIAGHRDKTGRVSGIGHIAHFQNTAKGAGFGRTGHKADFQGIGCLSKFGKHQDVNRIAVVTINTQGIAIFAIAVSGRVGEKLQTVECT